LGGGIQKEHGRCGADDPAGDIAKIRDAATVGGQTGKTTSICGDCRAFLPTHGRPRQFRERGVYDHEIPD